MTEPRPFAPLSCDEVRDLAAGFVLGALEDEQMTRLREHLSTCAEPHPEIDELGDVVSYLADTLEPVEPPAGLGRRILAAVAAEAAAGPPSPSAKRSPRRPPLRRSLGPRARRLRSSRSPQRELVGLRG